MNSNTDRQTFTEILPGFVHSLIVHMFNAGQEVAKLCATGQHDSETQLREKQIEIHDEVVAKVTALAEKIDAANDGNTFDVTPFILPEPESPAIPPEMEEFMRSLREAFGGQANVVAPGVIFMEPEPATQEMPVVTGEPVTDPAQVRSV